MFVQRILEAVDRLRFGNVSWQRVPDPAGSSVERVFSNTSLSRTCWLKNLVIVSPRRSVPCLKRRSSDRVFIVKMKVFMHLNQITTEAAESESGEPKLLQSLRVVEISHTID